MNRLLFAIKPGEKTPVEKNYKATATSDPATIQKWIAAGFNLGYVPAHGGETVIDLDRHGDKDGGWELNQWMKRLGKKLPDTFIVGTPSGGCHLYFKGVVPYDKINFLPGVDVICSKRYVVAAGSRTAKGAYRIVEDKPVAELPAWFIDEMRKMKGGKKAEAQKPLNLRIDADTPEKVAAAVEIIQNWPEAVEGERNNQLLQLMYELCKAGVSEAKARELYAEYGVDRIHLEPDLQEVATTIHSAYEGKESEFGSSSDQALLNMFGPAKYDMEDWRTVADRTVPDRKWIIQDWLLSEPGTVVLFSGQGGTGKSLIGLILAYCLATGEDWLGMPVEQRAKSIIISCEDSMQELARRLQKIEAAYKRRVEKGVISVWCRAGANNVLAYSTRNGIIVGSDFLKELKSKCAAHFGQDGGIVIFDTLSDFVAINENDRMQVSQFVKHILTSFASDLGVTVILLAHPNKTNSGFSGSTAWEGAARSRWELDWQKANGVTKVGSPLTLTLAKSNATMAGKQVMLRYGEDHLPHVMSETEEDTSVKDVLVGMIARAVEDGNPFGRDIRSKRPIIKMKITDPATGVALEEKEIKDLVDTLLAEGRIVVPHGKGGNFLQLPDSDSTSNEVKKQ